MTIDQAPGGGNNARRTRPFRETVVRSMRSVRIVRRLPDVFAIRANRAARAHVAAVDPSDRFFYVSTREYIARGLPVASRIKCARVHYRWVEERFDARFLTEVYLGTGLVLWQENVEGIDYSLALGAGNDSLYEGGATVVFLVDGERVGVLSFSRIDGAEIGHEHGPLLLVTRKQQTREREHRTAMRRAFARASVGELCMGAMFGIAQACGDRSLGLIRADVHPALRHASLPVLTESYDKFWSVYGATERGKYAYVAEVPEVTEAPNAVAESPASRDERRHMHIDRVRRSALTAIAARSVPGGAPAS